MSLFDWILVVMYTTLGAMTGPFSGLWVKRFNKFMFFFSAAIVATYLVS